IPLMTSIAKAAPRRPKGLVLAPTRELAAQIASELEMLGSVRNRTVETFYGGVGYGPQLNALRRGVDIVVACPGRLLDLLDRGALRLDDVDIVVIDEADRMADMGFLPVVQQLLKLVGENRQTLLFSATLGGDVEKLIRNFQRSPKRHVLNSSADDLGSRVHHFWSSDSGDRVRLTAAIVNEHRSAMVFCRTKRGVDRVTKQLAQVGVAAAPIHGDRSQAQRERALAAFAAAKVQVLVGTDVAARGIHVDNVGCVVHFDPPEDDTTYVHRSGRTGRAGGSGVVYSLVTRDQERAVRQLQKALGVPLRVDRPSIDLGPSANFKPLVESHAASWDVPAPRPGGQGGRSHGRPRYQGKATGRPGSADRLSGRTGSRPTGGPVRSANIDARSGAAQPSPSPASRNRSRNRNRGRGRPSAA
ncbi:MAG TPA: DEAD/DEAH box helicase, partial [Acidimicrobiales bacterium]|nr:DEAD/DEAH box helicase [Acidimicrobiales bacterium]